MATRAELLDIAKQAMDEGDEETANAVMDDIEKLSSSAEKTSASEMVSVEPKDQSRSYTTPLATGEGLVQGAAAFAEPAITVGTGMLGSAIGGLAGLARTPFEGVEKGAETSQAIQNAMTYQPRTTGGQEGLAALGGVMSSPYNPLNIARVANEYTGASQSLAESGMPGAATALDVGGDLLAGLGVSKLVAGAIPARSIASNPTQKINTAAASGVDEVQIPLTRPDEVTTKTLADSFADAGMKDRVNDIASNVSLNPERVAAAQRLEIDAPVATLSDNRSLQEIAGALAAAPGSKAAANLADYHNVLTSKAKQLIEEAGGDLDKGLVSNELKEKMAANISLLKSQSGDIYKQIDEAVPQDTIVNAKPWVREINARANKSEKGIDGLSQVEKDVYNTIK